MGIFKEFIDRIDFTEESFDEYSTELFFEIMKFPVIGIFGMEKLFAGLKNALPRYNRERLYRFGEIFYKFGKADEFMKALPKGFPGREEILQDLERKFR
jgi:hypothetical protein